MTWTGVFQGGRRLSGRPGQDGGPGDGAHAQSRLGRRMLGLRPGWVTITADRGSDLHGWQSDPRGQCYHAVREPPNTSSARPNTSPSSPPLTAGQGGPEGCLWCQVPFGGCGSHLLAHVSRNCMRRHVGTGQRSGRDHRNRNPLCSPSPGPQPPLGSTHQHCNPIAGPDLAWALCSAQRTRQRAGGSVQPLAACRPLLCSR